MKLILSLILCCLLCSAIPAIACSCVTSLGTPTRAPLIVSVEIVSMDTVWIKTDSKHRPNQPLGQYRAVIKETLKGKTTNDTIMVYSNFSSCGYPFNTGRKYLLHATPVSDNPNMGYPKGETHFWTSICMPTSTFSESKVHAIKEILKPGFDKVVPKNLYK